MIDDDFVNISDTSESNTSKFYYGDLNYKRPLTLVLTIILVGFVIANFITRMAPSPFRDEIKELSRLYHAEKKKNIELQRENDTIRANCEKLMTAIETWRRKYLESRDCLISQEPTVKKLVMFSRQRNCCYVPPKEAQVIALELIKMRKLFEFWLSIIREMRDIK